MEIAASLPSASGASALQGSPVVQELRQLMRDVDEIKTVREVLENEIKSATVDISKFCLESSLSYKTWCVINFMRFRYERQD